jgi:hypothetical protein
MKSSEQFLTLKKKCIQTFKSGDDNEIFSSLKISKAQCKRGNKCDFESLFQVNSPRPVFPARFFSRRKVTPWSLVFKRTFPTERPTLAGEFSTNFYR